jgi:hypothetical protein
MSYLIDGEEAEYVGSDNEAEEVCSEYNKGEIKDLNMTQMMKKKIASIHHYESQISLTNSECGSNNGSNNYMDNSSNINYISINETEMQSNFPSENSRVEPDDYETGNGYDTIRKFSMRKMEAFNSNDIKY